MTPTAAVALASLALYGVRAGSVRTLRPSGTDVVVAFCVRHGEPLHATGPDVATALERLATAAGHAARLDRQAVAS